MTATLTPETTPRTCELSWCASHHWPIDSSDTGWHAHKIPVSGIGDSVSVEQHIESSDMRPFVSVPGVRDMLTVEQTVALALALSQAAAFIRQAEAVTVRLNDEVPA